jgi:DNA-binding transcriptional MerR regulator
MIAKDQESFVIGRYLYSDVEHALAAALDLGPTELPALRARLKRFAGMGLPDSAPGTGTHRRYSSEDVGLLLIVLLLHSLGLSPAAAIATIKLPETRKNLAIWLRCAADAEATRKQNPNLVYLAVRVEDPGKTPSGSSPVIWIGGFRRWSKTVRGGNRETVVDLLERIERDPELWLGIRNLTLPVARLRGALPFA